MLFHPDRGTRDPIRKQPRSIRHIACHMFVNAHGKITPIRITVMEPDHKTYTYDQIYVVCSRKTNYAGIPSYEYDCEVMIHNLKKEITLQFFPETLLWFMLDY